jgi:hypothetical protein
MPTSRRSQVSGPNPRNSEKCSWSLYHQGSVKSEPRFQGSSQVYLSCGQSISLYSVIPTSFCLQVRKRVEAPLQSTSSVQIKTKWRNLKMATWVKWGQISWEQSLLSSIEVRAPKKPHKPRIIYGISTVSSSMKPMCWEVKARVAWRFYCPMLIWKETSIHGGHSM